MTEIKYAAVCDGTLRTVEYYYCPPNTKSNLRKRYQGHIEQIVIDKILTASAYDGLTDQSSCMSGVVHTLIQNKKAYSIITNKELSSSQAQSILKRMSSLSGDIESQIEQCLYTNDKVSEAQTRIQDVQLIMQKNVKTLIENSDEVTRMEVNSGNIKETAFGIQSQAR